MKKYLILILFLIASKNYSQEVISGKITYINESNIESPLEGVSVYWFSSSQGTTSDKEGNYSLLKSITTNKLVFKYIGFKENTVIIDGENTFNQLMVYDENVLDEVTVNKRKNTIQKSYFKTQNIVTISSDELLKAACCNISESFETNPSIDVNFSNAITGVKQIRMLGLESPYILITEENIPMVRGASQVFGLSFIPGTWVESMQITKGTGSVVNGFESISGQINVELKKPYTDSPVFINLFSSNKGRNEFNLHLNKKISERLSTGIFLHGNNNSSEHDKNYDGFLDHPKSIGVNLFNRWQYTNLEKGIVSFLGLRFMNDEKEMGENYEEGLIFIRAPWLSKINTNRFDSNFKLGYVNPSIPYQSIGFQMAYSNHDQSSFFGNRIYDINHDSFYSSLLYNSIIGNTMNKFKTGLNYSVDRFEEVVETHDNQYLRNDRSIGGFFEYSYDSLDKLSLVAGIRYDIHNNLGSFLTPRLHLRYQPLERSVLRFSIGSGRKSSNIFSENQNIFSTGRKIYINKNSGKFYGLDSEKALNYGISFRQGFFINNREGDITIDYYVTDFENQVVVDWEKQSELHFYNLEGKSFANSFQIEIDYQFSENINFKSAYKNYDVKKQYNSGLKQNPLTPKNRFFFNLDFSTNLNDKGSNWKYDFTYNWVGKQRLPLHTSLSFLNGYSPSYSLINTQLTRVFSKKLEIYIGGENIGNYTQENPILGSSNPYGLDFDSSIIYAPIHGSLVYLGLRFKL
ncbi:MAG TPA: TonB-dependent receptor [Flavobacteriaceae bacterium]|jgi:hypothetical protein|nr:TonB-dependent receptor [Flavobacteriaceae bacterium]